MKSKVSAFVNNSSIRENRPLTRDSSAPSGRQVNVYSSAPSAVTSTFNRSVNALTSRGTVVDRLSGVNDAVNHEEINDDEVDYDEDDDEEEEDDDEFAEHTIFTTSSSTLQPLSSSKHCQAYTNDTQENTDQDVNNLLERAARVRREFASGSSNSSLNSADAMVLSLRRSTVDATSSLISAPSVDVSTPGPSSSLSLRSNYARFKAGVSFDSSSDANNSNANVYHPLRRLSTMNNLKNQSGYNQSKSSSSLNYGTVITLCE